MRHAVHCSTHAITCALLAQHTAAQCIMVYETMVRHPIVRDALVRLPACLPACGVVEV